MSFMEKACCRGIKITAPCLLLLLAGCAASVPPRAVAPTQAFNSVGTSNTYGSPELAVAETGGDVATLTSLWSSRVADEHADKRDPDFVLGPGDVLRVSLPQLEGLKDSKIPISESDTIDLPLLGVIDVRGMTLEQLRAKLTSRVERYVYTPQVAVYLEHSENRVVAVMGSVKTPGRYVIASRTDTIMTMISKAGGTTKDAASRIIFIPAGVPSTRPQLRKTSEVRDSAMPAIRPARYQAARGIYAPKPAEADIARPPSMNSAVVIDLFDPANQRFLGIPVRSGDVIIVPAAGQVTVQGWVQRPGAFHITPGMTVLSAIGAAGGALFSSSATLLREQGAGNKVAIDLNLSGIQSGTEPDVPVQGGDVVVVNRSAVGAIPYSVYFLLNKMGWGIFPPL